MTYPLPRSPRPYRSPVAGCQNSSLEFPPLRRTRLGLRNLVAELPYCWVSASREAARLAPSSMGACPRSRRARGSRASSAWPSRRAAFTRRAGVLNASSQTPRWTIRRAGDGPRAHACFRPEKRTSALPRRVLAQIVASEGDTAYGPNARIRWKGAASTFAPLAPGDCSDSSKAGASRASAQTIASAKWQERVRRTSGVRI
jgi:hypothetical protein